MRDLDTPGGTFSEAFDINDAGQVIGFYDQTVFLYSGGITTDLNAITAVQAAGWDLWTAYAINNNGQIVGLGIINGQQHAYLLTPASEVPEPSSALLMLVGILGLAGIWRRREPAPDLQLS